MHQRNRQKHSYIATLVCGVIQCGALVFYFVSYFPCVPPFSPPSPLFPHFRFSKRKTDQLFVLFNAYRGGFQTLSFGSRMALRGAGSVRLSPLPPSPMSSLSRPDLSSPQTATARLIRFTLSSLPHSCTSCLRPFSPSAVTTLLHSVHPIRHLLFLRPLSCHSLSRFLSPQAPGSEGETKHSRVLRR